ncbi:hypothetical protein LINPERHAP2_LOCUS24990, partial [Linum perenne]
MSKDSGKKTEGGSRPETPSGEYSTARLPLMQPTLGGNHEILERAALQLAADWDIAHPRSEEGVRRLAMEQMAIGARLLGTAGALLSADRAHRAEQPQGSEELEKQLRESRAAAQQWKAKCSKAKKEMDEESARLLVTTTYQLDLLRVAHANQATEHMLELQEEKEKRYKVEGALTAAETEQKALKEKVALLEASKAEMAKALEDKTKSLKETAETLQTLKADVGKAAKEKAAEELGDRVQGAIDNALTAVRHELRSNQADCAWDQEQMFRAASRRLMAQEFEEESADSQVIPSDR